MLSLHGFCKFDDEILLLQKKLLQEEPEGLEQECIFPFIFEGIRYDTCALYDIEDLLFPVFRCPVRTIKNQYSEDGIPFYTVEDFVSVDGYCPTNFDELITNADESRFLRFSG